MHQIVKRFGATLANDRIDFSARPGEVHALLGENGAGKSTLMCQLSGVYRPTSGRIVIDGKPVRIHSPLEAARLGVGMVFQNFRLVSTLTAVENIVLGEKSAFWRSRSWKKAKQLEIAELAHGLGLPFPIDRPVGQLSVGEQQRVEIVKTLYRGARLIVLDEPTSVLTPVEVEELFKTLRALKAQGRTILLTTHKLKEVMAIADRITVLRKGKWVNTLETRETSEAALAQLMVGEQLKERRPHSPRLPGKVLLEVKDLVVHADHGGRSLNGLDLQVRAGEIVGVAGVAGNGQKELAEVLTGLRAWKKGQVSFQGKALKPHSVRGLIEAGLSHIPENRMQSGLAGSLDIVDNLLFKSYWTPERSKWGFLRNQKNRQWSQSLVDKFEVKTPSLDTPVHQLSGGNQQKLLFAREIHHRPQLMVAVHPTQGLDVVATEAVHALMEELRDEGRSVLLISEDLDEILDLADRIIVLFNGRISGSAERGEADRNKIGLWMAGVSSVKGVQS
jgi:simple sugar transport system ATP-binding protein